MTIDEFKKDVAPHMKKGYVAMDKDGEWTWYNVRPKTNLKKEIWETSAWEAIWFRMNLALLEKIEPVEDWTKSLIEVGK